ncbi:hypothetical protein LPJ66_012003, partial [Kickxella alabastrina]
TRSATLQPVLRTLQRGITRLHQDIGSVCDKNYYSLNYLLIQGKRQAETVADEGGDITMNDILSSFNDDNDAYETDGEFDEDDAMDVDSATAFVGA